MKSANLRDEAFMEHAISAYGDLVYRMAVLHTGSREDAKDVFQEVFFNLLQTDTPFTSEEHLKAWLLRAVLHRSRDLLGSAYRRHRADLREDLPFSEPEDAELWDAVQRLPQMYRDIIHLYYFEGYATGEIAALLGKKPATVRTQMRRARQALKKLLGGTFDETEPLPQDGRAVSCRGTAQK